MTIALSRDSKMYKVLNFFGAFEAEHETVCDIALNIFLFVIGHIFCGIMFVLSEIVTFRGYCYIITDFVDDVWDAAKEKLCVKIETAE